MLHARKVFTKRQPTTTAATTTNWNLQQTREYARSNANRRTDEYVRCIERVELLIVKSMHVTLLQMLRAYNAATRETFCFQKKLFCLESETSHSIMQLLSFRYCCDLIHTGFGDRLSTECDVKLAFHAVDMQRSDDATAVGAALVRAFDRLLDEIVAQLELLLAGRIDCVDAELGTRQTGKVDVKVHRQLRVDSVRRHDDLVLDIDAWRRTQQ
jgi:hypothetical protein